MSLVQAPIHDLLIRIKNAYLARRYQIDDVQYSKFKQQMLDLLKLYRFIDGYSIKDEGNKKFITVDLHITGNRNEDVPVVKFFSVPSRRWYIWWKEIRPVAAWRWIGIISTSQGLMATHEAKQKKLWGELIAEIY